MIYVLKNTPAYLREQKKQINSVDQHSSLAISDTSKSKKKGILSKSSSSSCCSVLPFCAPPQNHQLGQPLPRSSLSKSGLFQCLPQEHTEVQKHFFNLKQAAV